MPVLLASQARSEKWGDRRHLWERGGRQVTNYPTGEREEEKRRETRMESDGRWEGQTTWPRGAYWISKWPPKWLGCNSTCLSWGALIHWRAVHLKIFYIKIEIHTEHLSEQSWTIVQVVKNIGLRTRPSGLNPSHTTYQLWRLIPQPL